MLDKYAPINKFGENEKDVRENQMGEGINLINSETQRLKEVKA